MVRTLLQSLAGEGLPLEARPGHCVEMPGAGPAPGGGRDVGLDIDMQTALKAGMRSVGVLWGYQERERLVSGGADIVVDSPRDLLECL